MQTSRTGAEVKWGVEGSVVSLPMCHVLIARSGEVTHMAVSVLACFVAACSLKQREACLLCILTAVFLLTGVSTLKRLRTHHIFTA